ncbi:DsbA family protein [Alphaproteobacteria bacterium]|jgi:protein-disulfide isomerase|nr:DsbA family protein [Alphaproteobacteria bacterium]
MRTLFTLLVMFGLTFAPPVMAELDDAEKAEFSAMIRSYIEANPEIVRDALQQLAEREEKARLDAGLAFLSMSDGDPVMGNPDGSLVIYEFSDYNCGYCKRVFGPIQQVLAEDDDIRFVVKEFPILSQSSLIAAQAAIAAHGQGVFPQYHATMMTNPGAISMDTILAAARDAGADLGRLQSDMRSPETAAIINRTRQSAEQLQISGTPGLVIGSLIIPGAVSGEELRRLIAEERALRVQ